MFKYVNNTADIELLIISDGKESLITDAVTAFYEVITDTGRIELSRTIRLEIEGDGPEEQIYNLFSELIYLFDTQMFLCGYAEIREIKKHSLVIELKGEKADEEKHAVRKIIKAVTLHNFKIEHHEGQTLLRVIFDV